MKERLLITGIGGSFEEMSYSLISLRIILAEFEKLGCKTEIIDLRKLKLPLYRYRGPEKVPANKIKKSIDLLHKSDAIIFSSPEYHGTVSAAFKNFIDHLEFLSNYDPPYLTFKPIACISLGGGNNSGMHTLTTLINIAHSLRGITVSGNVAIPNAKKMFNKRGKLLDQNTMRRLKRLAGDIYFVASKLSGKS